MDLDTIQRVFNAPAWSLEKIEEAARGEANGSCLDTPEILMAFWLNLARNQAENHGQTVKEAEQEILDQAKQGLFG